ncbi:hypothetical protein COOONC_23189 [Cooperia oncophora]
MLDEVMAPSFTKKTSSAFPMDSLIFTVLFIAPGDSEIVELNGRYSDSYEDLVHHSLMLILLTQLHRFLAILVTRRFSVMDGRIADQ